MIKKICLAVLLSLTLLGCGKEPEVIQTKYFEVPMNNNTHLKLEIPVDWEVTSQDAFHYWEFNDSVEIYKTVTKVMSGELIGECYYSPTSVSRNFEDATITVNADKDKIATIGALLNKAEVVEREVLQYRELGLEYLPDYMDLPMKLTNNGLYMPEDCEDVTSTAFTAASTMDGTNYVTSWIMKSKIEDLKPLLHNLATCNTDSSKLVNWYENKEIYLAISDDKIVAARKLTYNQWCCYVASLGTYQDYVIKAMFNIDNVK